MARRPSPLPPHSTSLLRRGQRLEEFSKADPERAGINFTNLALVRKSSIGISSSGGGEREGGETEGGEEGESDRGRGGMGFRGRRGEEGEGRVGGSIAIWGPRVAGVRLALQRGRESGRVA